MSKKVASRKVTRAKSATHDPSNVKFDIQSTCCVPQSHNINEKLDARKLNFKTKNYCKIIVIID